MPWFKIDDTLWSHPKFAALSDAAQALWLRAGSYCAEKLTDGFLDDRIIATLLRGKTRTVDELVASGMWRRVRDGVQFHDWLEYQPSSETVKREREQARERMANVRANKRANVRANFERSSDNPGPVPGPDPDSTDTSHPPRSSPVPTAGAEGLDEPGNLVAKRHERALIEANRLGIRSLPKLRQMLEEATGIQMTLGGVLELVHAILAKAKDPNVRKVDAYIASACQKPHEIRELAESLDIGAIA